MDREMDEEIEHFLEQSVERYLKRGYDSEEARRLALIEFGGVEQIREETREERGVGRLVDFFRDLRHSLRSLARSPVLTATIVLTVGLGIGATTAIFAVINAVLIRPLPYPDPGELFYVYTDANSIRYPFSAAGRRVCSLYGREFLFDHADPVGFRGWNSRERHVASKNQPCLLSERVLLGACL